MARPGDTRFTVGPAWNRRKRAKTAKTSLLVILAPLAVMAILVIPGWEGGGYPGLHSLPGTLHPYIPWVHLAVLEQPS